MASLKALSLTRPPSKPSLLRAFQKRGRRRMLERPKGTPQWSLSHLLEAWGSHIYLKYYLLGGRPPGT
ncbi:hypothetical protein B6U83_03585 [Thermoplasmatales archaeon ex4484_36]|nr:MAG: hypothetical protein B6U83_03585 [Thermoplasmatales archaeon ex4484_36]